MKYLRQFRGLILLLGNEVPVSLYKRYRTVFGRHTFCGDPELSVASSLRAKLRAEYWVFWFCQALSVSRYVYGSVMWWWREYFCMTYQAFYHLKYFLYGWNTHIEKFVTRGSQKRIKALFNTTLFDSLCILLKRVEWSTEISHFLNPFDSFRSNLSIKLLHFSNCAYIIYFSLP